MANYGDLSEFFDDADFSFTWGDETKKINIPAAKVMKFTVEYQKHQKKESDRLNKIRELAKSGKDIAEAGEYDRWREHVLVAEMLGGNFSEKTFKFNGCYLAELQDKGVPMASINRLVKAITLKYIHGDLASEHYMLTGDLGEAVTRFSGKDRPMKNYHPSPATQPEAGETSVAD